MPNITIDYLRRDECQPLTTEQVADIKSQFHPSNTANVNIVPYEIYDEDGEEIKVGEVRKTIDGVKKKKSRYRKTIVFAQWSGDSGDLSSLNIETFYGIDSQSTYIRRDNGETTCLAFVNTDALGYSISFILNNGHLYASTKNFPIQQVVATICYTKSSDEWQPV